jgi:Tol biopolymer transport system component
MTRVFGHHWRFVVCGVVALGFLLPIAVGRADEPDPESLASLKALSESHHGFVVWESNRSGRWRLYRRELDGAGLRAIDPEENDREHYCPHLSPDGSRLVYLSYPAGSDTYQPGDPPGGAALFLMNADGSGNRRIADSARAYYEDRGAVWIDDNNLIYIDGEGFTRQLDLNSGSNSRLTKNGRPGGGFLVNATKTFATTGEPTFSPFDANQSEVAQQNNLGGCQPYFTQNGRWGFWMGGAGGPINRINLETREVSPIITLNDPRMPKGRKYLYFPMISRDGLWFAFAASPNEHDHFHSDYDIFIAGMNPDSLELIDKPVRISFDKGTDRFPDVFVKAK